MKKIMPVLGVILALSLFAGCAATDVVYKYSMDSFRSIVTKFPTIIKDDTVAGKYYNLTVDGETFLKISNDYAATGKEDLVLATPLKPFLDAKLDAAKLGEGYKVVGEQLYLIGDYGNGSGKKSNVSDALFESVKADRKALSYHQELDHYGIALPKGKFEFAKDYAKNDKDIVFVIAAKPLAEIGVDVRNIQGWIFMTMKDMDGSDMDVLLKPYDLK